MNPNTSASMQIAPNFYLNVQNLPEKTSIKPLETPLHHILVIDCSGSMYGDLPEIRHQLKNRLPSLVREADTVTILWFSGRDQYGVLIEAFQVSTAQDLNNLNTAIDRFLRPMGLTGFKQPLEEVGKVIVRVSQRSNGAFSLFWMTDGYDNQWAEKDILAATEALSDKLVSAALVEYGWYANRQLLTKMAERVGGTLIFAENFRSYDPAFEAAIRKTPASKKIEITLRDDPLHQMAFAISGDDVLSFQVGTDCKILVPENVGRVFYFSAVPGGSYLLDKDFPREALYAGLNLLSQRMLSNDILKVLKKLGDARFIKQYGNCFGKQKYSEFQDAVLEAMRDPTKRLVEGYNPDLVPDENAYTVLDALNALMADDGNLFFPHHPLFEYKRTSRATVDSNTVLTEAEQEEVAAISAAMAKTRDPKKIKALQEDMNKILNTKREGLKFVPNDPNKGYPVSKLVLNSSRPNVSAMVQIDGTVNLDLTDAPKGAAKALPNPFPNPFLTKITRNYTIIRDGILNVNQLPVQLSEQTFMVFKKEKLVEGEYDSTKTYLIDLRSLPIINRRMVKEVSAKALFEMEYQLLKVKGAQKVFNDYTKSAHSSSEGMENRYGKDIAEWLRDIGITDNGFAPKRVQAESTDCYISKELKTSLKGMSSLPKVSDVVAKLEAKKALKPSEQLLEPALREVQAFLASDIYKNSGNPDHIFNVWLLDKKKATTELARKLMHKLSEIKFSVILSQSWFKEFSSLDQNTMTIDADGTQLECKVELLEKEEKI